MSLAQRPWDAAEPLPPRFETSLDVLATVVAAYSLSTLSLALLGRLNPATLVASTAALSVAGISMYLRSGVPPQPAVASGAERRPRAAIPMALAALVIGVATASNLFATSEHFVVDRDPGVYLTTALAVAETGDLDLRAPSDEFSKRRLTPLAGGFPLSSDGERIYPQFMHLYPTMMAPALWVGGTTGLTLAPPLLASLAMLLFFGFAARLVGPWLGLFALTTLSTNWLQFHFWRDAYSENATQLFLFAALWILAGRTPERRGTEIGRAVIGGVLLGLLASTRVDAIIMAAGLFGALIVARELAVTSRAQSRLSADLVLVATAAATGLLGQYDVRTFSPVYFAGLTDRFADLLLGSVAIVISSIVVAAFVRRLTGNPGLHRLVRGAGATVALSLVLVASFQLTIRPAVAEHEYPSRSDVYDVEVRRLQVAEGLPVAEERTYSEDSLLRLAGYFGWPLILLGVTGLGLIAWRGITKGDAASLSLLAATIPLSVLYMQFARNTPDMPWLLRRFAAGTVPLLIICSALAIAAAVSVASRAGRPTAIGTGLVLVAAALAPSLIVSVPAVSITTYQPLAAVTDDICDGLGADDVLLIDVRLRTLAPALHYRCDNPVAVDSIPLSPTGLARLARAWGNQGARLRLLSVARDYPTVTMPDVTQPTEILHTGYVSVSQSLEGVPEPTEPVQDFPIWLLTPEFDRVAGP